ncbi:hypothetical protein IM543_14430 [Massilia sp. UMI-21]|nr:hypothetical protein IM543_14430 [Massilia sp. UMI-21]
MTDQYYLSMRAGVMASLPGEKMDIHTRIVGVLHIAFSVLSTFVSFLVLGVSGATAVGSYSRIPEFVVEIGAIAIVVRLALAVAQILGGVFLLRGRPSGRIMLILFGVLDLFIIPIGTALGIYTLWVLLRKQPIPGPASPDPMAGA